MTEPPTLGTSGGADVLLPRLYDELHELAARALRGERRNHTLQPTALVNEAYVRLVGQTHVDWKGRTHFLGVAAQMIRRILVDHARRKAAAKRGGALARVTLLDGEAEGGPAGIDLLALHDALEELEGLNARQRQLVELRFFGGLTEEEAAQVVGISARMARLDWRMARAWLSRRLGGGD
jgi:RNA polymerase sigma-70 factor (ECF subfamily)